MAAPELSAGHIVGGRYTVVGSMGRGERVTTYEAVSAPNRQVVVKLYDPALGPPTLATLRAAEAVTRDLPRGAALEVIEVGVDGGSGAAMVVTERSPRPSLAQLVQLCPLSAVESATLARNLARALGAAHERGLPHLGLKPSNVFVGPAPACEVQLADFGSTVARAAPGGAAVDPLDVPWLAPEQVFGGAAPGVASDVFSAALVVFFALTGRSYWRTTGADPVDPAVWSKEVWGARLGASARAAELGHAIGAEWDEPFARALDADPARRPGSIAELAEGFERASQGLRMKDAHMATSARPRPVAVPTLMGMPVPGASMRPAPEQAPAPVPAPAPSLTPYAPPPPRAQAPTFVITRRPPRPAPWVVGVVVGLIVLGGVAVVGVKLVARTTHAAVQPAPSAPASAPAAVAPTAIAALTSSEPAVPEPSAEPPIPAPSETAAPAPSASTPAIVAPPGRSVLVVTCNPPCDSVWVDGHLAADVDQGRTMPPGVHQVGANLARHPSRIQPVLLRGGQVFRLDVDFTH